MVSIETGIAYTTEKNMRARSAISHGRATSPVPLGTRKIAMIEGRQPSKYEFGAEALSKRPALPTLRAISI